MADPTKSDGRNNWAALWQQATDAVFLLNPRRRVRYLNRAFETLTGYSADAVVHEYALPVKFTKQLPAGVRALLQTMAPPKEVLRGRVATVRRPAPPLRYGPPWWDIAFLPLRDGDHLLGILGIIHALGGTPPPPGTKGLAESLIGLRERTVERRSLSQLFEGSPTLRRLHAQAELAAQTKAPVWLSGAAGTGKETLARAVHFHGCTREGTFVAIDAAGLQPYLIRSMLFGHNGLAESGRLGTVYLKAPEALPVDLQIELADWHEIEDDPPRYIIGARPDVAFAPEFRARFGVLEFALPTLREQPDAIPRLLNDALHAANVIGHAPEVVPVLQAWPWTGNYREWHDVMRQAMALASGGPLQVENLPLRIRRAYHDSQVLPNTFKQPPPRLDDVLEHVERRMLQLALQKAHGDQTAAAALLDIHRSRFLRRLKVLGLE